MAYTTGSGDYNALMTAVLNHAIADGWTEINGVGTGWPITKGIVGAVAWTTWTASETDYTNGTGQPHTTRYINLAVANTAAAAATLAGDNTKAARFPNMEYPIDQWHIFSDPAAGDYVHVVIQFATANHGKVFGHFSFGAINKEGMSYTGLIYATAHPARGFSPYVTQSNNAPNSASDANAGVYNIIKRAFTGYHHMFYTKFNNGPSLCCMFVGPTSPFPANPAWPALNARINEDLIHDSIRPGNSAQDLGYTGTSTTSYNVFYSQSPGMSYSIAFAKAHLYSGGISMAPLPFLMMNATTNTAAQCMYLGSFPDVRLCSLENFAEGDVVNYGSDEWMVFPMLRKTVRTSLQDPGQVTSGQFGYAYRKVI